MARKGTVIGTTTSGKPVYKTSKHKSHDNFDQQEYKESVLIRHTFNGRVLPVVDIDTLALHFSHVLQRWLDDKKMAEIIRLNDTHAFKGTGCCASHDFCDPNQAMLDAFEKLHKREFFFGCDADSNLFNRAWTIAQNNNFYTSK